MNHLFFLCNFHSALATLINNSSSRTGIQLVKTFIAFSKSESNRISRVPSTSAAEAACRTSRPPLKDLLAVSVGVIFEAGEVVGGEEDEEEEGGSCCREGLGRGGSESPRSMKTSQTRSWAGKGIE